MGRSFESLWNEKNKLILLLLQPALISLLIKIVSDEDVFKLYESTRNILFALTCAGIWIGLFNSIQEICRERKIVKREYMSGLNLGLYIIAKFCVQIVISLLQAALISGIFYGNRNTRSGSGIFQKCSGYVPDNMDYDHNGSGAGIFSICQCKKRRQGHGDRAVSSDSAAAVFRRYI